MKTVFGLVSKKVAKTVSGLEIDIINALNSIDPELVQEYQLEQYEKQLTALVQQMVQAEKKYNTELKEYQELSASFNSKKSDAEKVQAAIDNPETSEEKQAKFSAHLELVLNELEQMKENLPSEEEDATNAHDHYTTLKEVVDIAAKKLATAKVNIKRKQAELQRLGTQEERIKQQEESQRVLMGLKQNVDKFSGVMDAMDKEIAAKKDKIAESKAQTEALKKANAITTPDGDVDIAELLGKTPPPKRSSAERLKNL
jgi:chromosome segregation ATPase